MVYKGGDFYTFGIYAPYIPLEVHEQDEWIDAKMEEIRRARRMKDENSCPSFPYMCHNDNCGCRIDIQYRQC